METYDQSNEETRLSSSQIFGWYLVFSIRFLVTCIYNQKNIMLLLKI